MSPIKINPEYSAGVSGEAVCDLRDEEDVRVNLHQQLLKITSDNHCGRAVCVCVCVCVCVTCSHVNSPGCLGWCREDEGVLNPTSLSLSLTHTHTHNINFWHKQSRLVCVCLKVLSWSSRNQFFWWKIIKFQQSTVKCWSSHWWWHFHKVLDVTRKPPTLLPRILCSSKCGFIWRWTPSFKKMLYVLRYDWCSLLHRKCCKCHVVFEKCIYLRKVLILFQ